MERFLADNLPIRKLLTLRQGKPGQKFPLVEGNSAVQAFQAGFTQVQAEGMVAYAGRQAVRKFMHSTPADSKRLPDFSIGTGHFYVEGILCENETPVKFSQQPDYPGAKTELDAASDHDAYLVYLDGWERHITAAEDPSIREVALGGPDTSTRVKTVWQVKLLPLPSEAAPDENWREQDGLRSLDAWKVFEADRRRKGQLAARMDPDKEPLFENRLYRVEIHAVSGIQVVWKWSRENGSIVFPISSMSKSADDTLLVTLGEQGYDLTLLRDGSWVELADETLLLNNQTPPLCQVKEVDRMNACITLQGDKKKIRQIYTSLSDKESRCPLLRCWDNDRELKFDPAKPARKGALKWFDLEKGLQVAFGNPDNTAEDAAVAYHVGDCWTIPARTRLISGIEWPIENDRPRFQPPHGTAHSFAPLALLQRKKEAWQVFPETPTDFDSLPQIKAQLNSLGSQAKQTKAIVEPLAREVLAIESARQEVLTCLERVREIAEPLSQQAHVIETVKSIELLEPGDVVAIDTEREKETVDIDPENRVLLVKRAGFSDSHRVIGVVWDVDTTGIEKSYRIVVHGRTRCKVIGRVEPGDLLVPSDVDGCARKSRGTPIAGTILGKALSLTRFDPGVMEGLEKGTIQVDSDLDEQPGMVDSLVTLS